MRPLRAATLLCSVLLLAGCTITEGEPVSSEGESALPVDVQRAQAVELLGTLVGSQQPLHPDGDPERVMLGILRSFTDLGSTGLLGYTFEVPTSSGPLAADLVEGKVASMQLQLTGGAEGDTYQTPVCIRMLVSKSDEPVQSEGPEVGVFEGAAEGICE